MWAPISPAGTLILSVRFDKAPQSLPAVVTTGVAPSTVPLDPAFEERRAIGAGQFVTEADLRKHDMRRMTAIVRQLSGVMVECPRGITPPSCYAQNTRQRSNTAMLGGGSRADIYVDGVVWTETDLETFAVNDYAVVEYCNGPATIPVQYNRTGSSCGVNAALEARALIVCRSLDECTREHDPHSQVHHVDLAVDRSCCKFCNN